MKYAAILVFATVVFTGCGIKQIRENTTATRLQTEQIMQKQQAQMQADAVRDSTIAAMQAQLAQQDDLIRGLRAFQNGRFDGIEQQLNRLGSRLQETTGKFSDVAMGVNEVRRRVMGDSTNADTASARVAIDAAESDLARGNVELSVAGYNTFLERWGNSPLAATAYFGRAKAKLALHDTSGAIADFRASGMASPATERSAPALWLLGKLHKSMNDDSSARTVWKELVSRFPDSIEAIRANEQLSQLDKEEKKSRRRR